MEWRFLAKLVMPGLVQGIHVLAASSKTWMAGTRLRQGFAGLSSVSLPKL
jgi:hypothetical protein